MSVNQLAHRSVSAATVAALMVGSTSAWGVAQGDLARGDGARGDVARVASSRAHSAAVDRANDHGASTVPAMGRTLQAATATNPWVTAVHRNTPAVVLTAAGLARGSAGSAAMRGATLTPGDRVSLATAIRRTLGAARGNLGVEVRDRVGGTVFSYRPELVNTTGSIVKVLVLVATIRKARSAGRGLTAGEQALAARMIKVSDNDATTTLFRAVGGASAITANARALGMMHTTGAAAWGRTSTTAGDQRLLMDALVDGTRRLSAADRRYILGLMGSVVADQRWGVGKVPAGTSVQLKNGWVPLTPYGWRVNSIGHVAGHGRDYDIAIVSYRNATMSAGVSRVNAVSSLVYKSLATPWK